MKKALIIIAILLVVAVVVYFVWNKKKANETATSNDEPLPVKDGESVDDDGNPVSMLPSDKIE